MNGDGGPTTLRVRAGALLVRFYPTAWRTRYGAEMLALIEDDPPSPRGLASLLTGAVDAHLHPQEAWRTSVSPAVRMRLSICAAFCCWIVMSLMGAGFQQETEDGSFSLAAESHPLLAIARAAIMAGAALGALSIAIGGLPLVWQALRAAYHRRDRKLAALLALPAVALVCFRGLMGLLVILAPAREGHFPLRFVLTAGVPWILGGILWASACSLAPRWVLARADPPAGALRLAARTSIALALAMAAVTAGLLTYASTLVLQAPGLAAQSSGPVGASTGAMLGTQAFLAALAGSLGLLGALRARRAAAELI
jgi:hypothetical protein